MTYKLQTVAIAFLIFLSTLCGAQSLRETTDWMHNFAATESTWTDLDGDYHSTTLVFAGCQVTQMELINGKTWIGFSYSLTDIDPTSIRSSGVYFSTSNNVSRIETLFPQGTVVEEGGLYHGVVNFVIKEDAVRFTRAFIHAILLCGGKPSTF